MAVEARRVLVRGRVQGVGFRAFVAGRARRAGASGWVRNRPDGTVEAHVEGSPDAVAAVVDACRSGPRGAGVDGVDEEPAEPTGAEGFATG